MTAKRRFALTVIFSAVAIAANILLIVIHLAH
jgi:hypothetical protein